MTATPIIITETFGGTAMNIGQSWLLFVAVCRALSGLGGGGFFRWFALVGVASLVLVAPAHAERPPETRPGGEADPANAKRDTGSEPASWRKLIEWSTAAVKVTEPLPLIGVGEDFRAVYQLSGRTLSIHPLESGKVRRLVVPRARWTSLHLSPPTDGEIERAALVAREGADKGRLVLVHLRTGRIIGDWSSSVQLPVTPQESTIHWSPDGQRLIAVGWPLDGPSVFGELAVRQVESSLGAIVGRTDVGDIVPVDSAFLLGDGRTLALLAGPRVVLLGPGPIDARTMAVPSGSRLVGATADGLLMWRHDRLLVVEPGERGKAKVLFELTAEGLTGEVESNPRGRFALAKTTDGDLLLDARKGLLLPLAEVPARRLLMRDRLVVFERARVGVADLFRLAPL